MLRHLCLLSFCFALNAAPQSAPPKNPPAAAQPSVKKVDPFKPFTGKIVANKVRIRAKADIEGHIIRQVNKGDLLLIVGEEGDFYAVEPPKDTKAYVFRSYILDDCVEANRVNVRLEPHVDAPIIAQLQAGDKVHGQVCSMNHKWIEIAPPKSTRFFVSKEYIGQAGGPEFIVNMEKRKVQVDELLRGAYFNAEAECKKTFEEMAPQHIIDQFQTILRNFADFPEVTAQAKDGLALLKETYLNKKINYLEARAELTEPAKKELLAKHKEESRELFADAPINIDPELWSKRPHKKDNISLWDTIEESLYLSWTAFHAGKKVDDFYAEQKANASLLTGFIEPYDHDVRNKPGEFVLRSSNAPIAYLYSTHVDLEKYAGKTVTVLVSPRPNNHFAFPAYYVLGVE
ncbi:MAG TPA: SH3 domain-containing protein [Chlamydiales bacterium]|nr:SH3 domain-containing protein [Chlamydiales bacterium]